LRGKKKLHLEDRLFLCAQGGSPQGGILHASLPSNGTGVSNVTARRSGGEPQITEVGSLPTEKKIGEKERFEG